ncbi:MAG TPA: carboxynorspermidine decarboxylase, partial [Bacteroidales bacterium]|nr:carboxynorspermidine decarboxylase [Bacteroidales bacterium]
MSEEYFEQFPSPCYIMFEEALEANLQLLDLVQREADVSIICALKGFSFWHSFPLIKHYLQGAAASSVNEARLIVEEMGCEAHTYSPVYTDEEFEHYLVYSKFLTFNSLHQWSRFRDRVLAFPRKKIRCGLRVNPEFSAVKTALYNPALPGSRLGILAEQMPKQLPEG